MLTSTNHRQGEYSQLSSDLLFFRFRFWSDFALFCILWRFPEMFGMRSHNCSFTFTNNSQCAQFRAHCAQCAMYCVQCTVNNVLCTMYNAHCAHSYIHCTHLAPYMAIYFSLESKILHSEC